MRQPPVTVRLTTPAPSQSYSPTRRAISALVALDPQPRPAAATPGLARPSHATLHAEIGQAKSGHSGARPSWGAAAPQKGAQGGGARREAPGAVDQGAPIELDQEAARQPARQVPTARKPRISAPFRPPFQHDPSNMARSTAQKRQISAIFALRRIRAAELELERLVELQLAQVDRPPAGEIAKTSSAAPPRHTHPGTDRHQDKARAAISGRQNNREPRISADQPCARACRF